MSPTTPPKSAASLPVLEELAHQLRERRDAEYAKVDEWFAGELKHLVEDVGVKKIRLAKALGTSRSGLDRWMSAG